MTMLKTCRPLVAKETKSTASKANYKHYIVALFCVILQISSAYENYALCTAVQNIISKISEVDKDLINMCISKHIVLSYKASNFYLFWVLLSCRLKNFGFL